MSQPSEVTAALAAADQQYAAASATVDKCVLVAAQHPNNNKGAQHMVIYAQSTGSDDALWTCDGPLARPVDTGARVGCLSLWRIIGKPIEIEGQPAWRVEPNTGSAALEAFLPYILHVDPEIRRCAALALAAHAAWHAATDRRTHVVAEFEARRYARLVGKLGVDPLDIT